MDIEFAVLIASVMAATLGLIIIVGCIIDLIRTIKNKVSRSITS